MIVSRHTKLIPFRKNAKWGLCTPDKKIVVDCIYSYMFEIQDGSELYDINCVDGIWWQGESVYYTPRWGALNREGKTAIPFIYDNPFKFREEKAAVALKGKWGYIWIYR